MCMYPNIGLIQYLKWYYSVSHGQTSLMQVTNYIYITIIFGNIKQTSTCRSADLPRVKQQLQIVTKVECSEMSHLYMCFGTCTIYKLSMYSSHALVTTKLWIKKGKVVLVGR